MTSYDMHMHTQGAYQLLDIIGKGAFGCAYKARHLPTGRLVCIKTLEAPTGKQQEEELTKQRREVAVLAALALHPNIIRWVKDIHPSTEAALLMASPAAGDLELMSQRFLQLCWCRGSVAQPCSGHDYAFSSLQAAWSRERGFHVSLLRY